MKQPRIKTANEKTVNLIVQTNKRKERVALISRFEGRVNQEVS